MVTRRGKTTGRWPEYTIVVDGEDAGRVKRCLPSVGANYSCERGDGWDIGSTTFCTREEAEAAVIERFRRFKAMQE